MVRAAESRPVEAVLVWTFLLYIYLYYHNYVFYDNIIIYE